MQDISWVDIEGYPNYIVSNHGQVLSLVYDEELVQRSNGRGYMRVALSEKGVVRDFYVHQLVAAAFMADFRDGMHIAHRDNDQSNNAIWNLIVRRKRTRLHRTYIPRERGSSTQVRIRETGEIFRTIRDCAAHIGGDYSTIYRCLRGLRGTHYGYTFEYYEGEE